jgi:hypothetical protein
VISLALSKEDENNLTSNGSREMGRDSMIEDNGKPFRNILVGAGVFLRRLIVA